MLSLGITLSWVLPSVLIALGVGFYLGRSSARPSPSRVEQDSDEPIDRKSMLRLLADMLRSAEKLTTDVDAHTHELEHVGRSVGELQTTGEMSRVQHEILQQITRLLQSNRDLENDLTCTRYKLEQQAAELDRTRREARTDILSGVGNRMAFDERLKYLVSRFETECVPFVLVLLDMDKFKWINDTHGHQAGDRVLAQLGTLLHDCVRGNDIVARYGGDEFAILFDNIDETTAARVTDRIRVILERHTFTCDDEGEQKISVTCSLGLAGVRSKDTIESILHRADLALYAAKQGGRNQVSVCSTATI